MYSTACQMSMHWVTIDRLNCLVAIETYPTLTHLFSLDDDGATVFSWPTASRQQRPSFIKDKNGGHSAIKTQNQVKKKHSFCMKIGHKLIGH